MHSVNRRLTFGIMSDLHGEIMSDSNSRLIEFINYMNNNRVDFIIQIGDFTHLKFNGEEKIRLFNKFNGNKYHVLGNHDTDDCTKEEAIQLLNMKNNYYSYKIRGFKCIVLDTNYLYCEKTNQYIDFDKFNLERDRSKPCLPPDQLRWLKKEVEIDDEPIIIFSHASLINEKVGIINKQDLFKCLDDINDQAGYKKIIACINGHDHFDSLHERHGIYYIGIPSISNQWLEKGHINTDIDKELLLTFPKLENVVPYTNPLYTIIEINRSYIKVKGRDSEYKNGEPIKYGQNMKIGYDYMSPNLREKVLPIGRINKKSI